MTIASEITRLQGAKADIKTAIENKGVTVSSADTIDQYAGYIDQIETGTTIVNGVIENYLASTSTVDTGTFVEFVNTIGARTQLNYSNATAEAVALEDGKVFVAYRKGTYGNRYAVIATISGGTVSFGTEVLLSTNTIASYFDTYMSASPDNSRVLVSWTGSTTAACAVCCAISGDTITAGVEFSTAITSGSPGTQGLGWLSDNNAFLAIGYGNAQLRGCVLTIDSELNITNGTFTTLTNASNDNQADFCIVSSTAVIGLKYQTSSNATTCGYAFWASINGETITVGNTIRVTPDSVWYSYIKFGQKGSAVRINNTDIGVLYVGRQKLYTPAVNYLLYSCRLSISSGSLAFVAGNEILGWGVEEYSDGNNTVSSVKVMEGSDGPFALLNYTSSDGGNIFLAKLRIAKTGFAIKEYQQVYTASGAPSNYSGALLGANGLVAISTSSRLYAYPLIAKVKPAEIEVSGLTKTEATTSVPGEVWVLNS